MNTVTDWALVLSEAEYTIAYLQKLKENHRLVYKWVLEELKETGDNTLSNSTLDEALKIMNSVTLGNHRTSLAFNKHIHWFDYLAKHFDPSKVAEFKLEVSKLEIENKQLKDKVAELESKVKSLENEKQEYSNVNNNLSIVLEKIVSNVDVSEEVKPLKKILKPKSKQQSKFPEINTIDDLVKYVQCRGVKGKRDFVIDKVGEFLTDLQIDLDDENLDKQALADILTKELLRNQNFKLLACQSNPKRI